MASLVHQPMYLSNWNYPDSSWAK